MAYPFLMGIGDSVSPGYAAFNSSRHQLSGIARLAYDEGAIETTFRGPGIPDSDHYVVALGAGYRVRDNLTLDAAYQHLFYNDGATRRGSATGSTLVGEFAINVDILSVGATWQF